MARQKGWQKMQAEMEQVNSGEAQDIDALARQFKMNEAAKQIANPKALTPEEQAALEAGEAPPSIKAKPMDQGFDWGKLFSSFR